MRRKAVAAAPPPFPPRPRAWGRGLSEPSVPWQLRAAVLLLGARRVVTKAGLQKRLELSGLTWDEIAPILARIRSVGGWGKTWRREAESSERAGDWGRAAAQAFLGHLLLSPFNPQKAALLDLLRRCHARDRAARPGGATFERVTLADGALRGYLERPRASAATPKPLVLLLPPLASTKEELFLLGDPLLDAGYSVLRLDLPGQGESPPPLTINVERLLARALDELGVTAQAGCFAGGISLGAYFALRLGGADRARVRGVFGVSPPAIITPEQWAKQDEVIWQYLDLYFDTETREETLRLGLSMTLDDVAANVSCPVRLYHARNDWISLPDAPERYRNALAGHAPLSDRVLNDIHGCTLHLRSVIAPEIVAWCDAVAEPAKGNPSLPGEPSAQGESNAWQHERP